MKKLFSLLTLALLTMSAWAANTYVKVTSTNQLVADQKYILVNEEAKVAMGAIVTYGSNNVGSTVEININSSIIDIEGTAVVELTLGQGSNDEFGNATWTFDIGGEGHFIMWESGNTLNTVNSAAPNNAMWTATSTNDGFVLNNKADNTRKLQYNAGSPRFACYTSSQKPAVLYVQDASAVVPETVAAPTLPASQNFEDSYSVVITNNDDDATVMYSIDEKATWNTYSAPFTINTTTTVYAKAVKGNVESAVVNATYTKVESGIATLDAANKLTDGTSFTFTGDAVVTYHNGKYMFLRDDSGYGLIYYDAAPATNFANGAVLSQNWTATKTTYKSLVEYQHPANVSASGVSNSALAAVQTIQASQMADMINAYVKIEHVKSISGTTATLTDGTTITLYNRFTDVTIPEFTDQDCSITGIVSIFNDALQLYFIESDYNSSVEPPVEGTTFELVTDAASLADGDKIIIVNNEAAKAMGAFRTNNFGAVNVTINDNIIVTDSANVITLEAQDNNWALKANEGYLYAASSSANHLKPKAEVDGDAIASIAIENNEANITFQGQYSHNILRYNKGSVLFSCYASGQEPVFIYKATTDVPPVTVEAPVLSPKHNTKFIGSQDVTITCATEGATIYYTTDSVYQVYTAPFTINATTTVKAYAELNGVTSSTVSAKYIKLAEVNTIAEANDLDNKVDFIFYGNVVVTYQNGSNLWIRDASGSGLIYGNQVPTFEQGTVLAEEWMAQKYNFRGGLVPEFQYPDSVKAAEDEPIQTVEPFERETLALNNVNEYVIMKGLTIIPETNQSVQDYQKYFYNAADSLVLYNQFGIQFTLEEGKTYDVVGTVTVYNEKPQLYIISVTEAAAAGLRGDVDNSGNVDISDATALINYLLYGNSEGLNLENANCDLTGGVDISDATTLINYLLYGTWPN